MAIPANIEDLINQRIVESTRIEFKEDYNPTPIIHSICAFANDIDNMGGGYIIIGVEEENGSPKFPIDDRPNLAADLSELDIGLMRSHLKEIGSDLYPCSLFKDAIDIAKDMQLVSGPPKNLKPLNVAILMFTECPEKYFRYAKYEDKILALLQKKPLTLTELAQKMEYKGIPTPLSAPSKPPMPHKPGLQQTQIESPASARPSISFPLSHFQTLLTDR